MTTSRTSTISSRAHPSPSASERPPVAAPIANGALVLRALAGDLDAYAVLVERFEGRLYNFLRRRLTSPEDAEDLTQETFLRAWENLHRYDDRWQFSTWLFTIGHRLALSHLSRRPRAAALETAGRHAVADGPDPARQAAGREQAGLVWGLVERLLNERQRSMLWLRYAEDFGVRDIARIMDVSPVVVRVTLFRAREKLAAASGATAAARDGGPITRQLAGDLSW